LNQGKLINVFCWKPEPGNYWRCYEGVSGITVDATSKDEAIGEFNNIWNFRTPVQWIYEAPKRPKRPDVIPQTDRLLEHESAFRRTITRRFHSDLVGDRTFSADEVLAIVNEAWDMTRPKA
jgi:hypothetical protein